MNWDDEENGMNKELHFLRGHTKTTMTTSSAYSDLLELGNTLQGKHITGVVLFMTSRMFSSHSPVLQDMLKIGWGVRPFSFINAWLGRENGCFIMGTGWAGHKLFRERIL